MVKLVNTTDLKSVEAELREGSNPSARTIFLIKRKKQMDFFAKLAFIGFFGGSLLILGGTIFRAGEEVTPYHKDWEKREYARGKCMQQIGITFLVIGTLSYLFG